MPVPPGLFDLARGGVCRALPVTREAVGSYPTVSPLPGNSPETGEPPVGGLFSVALSLGRPRDRVGVTHHRVLPCSDFPQSPRGDRGRLAARGIIAVLSVPSPVRKRLSEPSWCMAIVRLGRERFDPLDRLGVSRRGGRRNCKPWRSVFPDDGA